MERNTFMHPWEIQTQMTKYKHSAPFEVVPYGGAFFSSLVVTISSTNSVVLTNTNDYIQRNLCSLIFLWFVFVKTLSSSPTPGERRGCPVSFAHLFGSWAKIFVSAIGGILNSDLWIRGGYCDHQWSEIGSSVYGTTSKGAQYLQTDSPKPPFYMFRY